jgi:outer membrane lipase/esterase
MEIPRLSSLARPFRKQLATLCLAAASAGLPVAAPAGQFADAFFFGDSLSDTGNLQAMTTQLYLGGQFPSPYPTYPGSPYFDGRFSNGPLWVEYLSDQMNLPGKAAASGFSLPPGPPFFGAFVPADGGNDFAVAGARTGTTGFFETLSQPIPIPTGVQTQVGQFLAEKGGIAPDAETLYVMLAGGNNIRDTYLLDKTLRDAAAANAAANYAQAVGMLADAGAKTILVGNVQDMGKIPEAISLGKSAAATAASRVFNARLIPLLARLEAEKGVRLIRLDVFKLFDAVYFDATLHGGATYGLTNATIPCFPLHLIDPKTYPEETWTGADCAVAIFADDIHPTTAAHSILGQAAAACRDGEGAYLGQAPIDQRLTRFCQTRQSP